MSIGTLFRTTAELAALNAALDESGGELTPGVEAAFAAAVADEAAALDDIYGLIATLTAEKQTARNEEVRFAEMRQAREKRIDRIKELVKFHLEATGRHKAASALGRTFRVAINGGPDRLVVAEGTDPAAVPDQFQVRTVVVEIDRPKVIEALKAGGQLPFAWMQKPTGTHLRIS